MQQRRARTEPAKAERRDAILDAAGHVFDDVEFDDFTMDAVATSLGLAKGTLYRYVATREALLLDVLRIELDRWFLAVDGSLDGEQSRRELGDHLVASLVQRRRLLRLLAVLPSVLERNIPFEVALDFKSFLLARTAHTGSLIDGALGAPRGSGVRLLVHLNAGVIGLSLGAHPSPVVAEVLAGRRFAPLRVDLRRELTHLINALLGAIPTRGEHP